MNENTSALEAAAESTEHPGEPADPLPAHPNHNLRWVVLGLVALSLWTMWPLWAPILLAAWFAVIAAPVQRRLASVLGNRARGSAVLTTALVLILLVPLVVVAIAVLPAAFELLNRVRSSESAQSALSTLAGSGDGHFQLDLSLVRRNAQSLADKLPVVASMLGSAVIGVMVFFYAFYFFLVRGSDTFKWLAARSPLSLPVTKRFASAFASTGRGLLIGTGLTALVQGGLAGVGFTIAGIPNGWVLGVLTTIASLVPAVGSGLVWVPLAIAMGIQGDTTKLIWVLAIGGVVSVTDNVLRPVLSGHDNLQLPVFVVFVAMLASVSTLGAIGLFAGPLIVRLCKEGLDILREQRIERDRTATTRASQMTP